MKAAVSRIVNVLNFFSAPLFPKGIRVTTLEFETVHLSANRAEHTQAPASFPMEPIQLFFSCVEGAQTYVLDFTGGGCQYNLFLLLYTIKKEKD